MAQPHTLAAAGDRWSTGSDMAGAALAAVKALDAQVSALRSGRQAPLEAQVARLVASADTGG